MVEGRYGKFFITRIRGNSPSLTDKSRQFNDVIQAHAWAKQETVKRDGSPVGDWRVTIYYVDLDAQVIDIISGTS